MLHKRSKVLQKLLSTRGFSVETSSSEFTSDSDGPSRVKNIIDPLKGQYTDFLQNVSVIEEANEDTLKAMYYLNHS